MTSTMDRAKKIYASPDKPKPVPKLDLQQLPTTQPPLSAGRYHYQAPEVP